MRRDHFIVLHGLEDSYANAKIAKRQAIINHENTSLSKDSLVGIIGRKYDEVKEEAKQVPYKVVSDDNGNVELECPAHGRLFAPEEISALVLRKLADDALKFLNDQVCKAVITVPAYYDDYQRNATKDAANIAGLDALRIINETTAAALAYGFEKKKHETILVFDLGGGTFDVSDGVFKVLSTPCDTHLGGDDFDKRGRIDLLKDKQALQRLTEAAEKAKMELSSFTLTVISSAGPIHINTTLTRAKYEELCTDLLDRLRAPVQTVLKDVKLSLKEVDEVILVGGSTRIPAAQDLVTKLTGKEPNLTVNPDEVVALGAAVQAAVLAGEVSDIVLLDVTPLSWIIPRNKTIPSSKTEVFSTVADGQTNVEINVYQGERELVKDNKLLGRFRLEGIPPAPRGQYITIIGASTLPSRKDREAERYAKEDEEKRDAIDTRNQADPIVYQNEKQLKELGGKLPLCVTEKVEAKLKELKEAISIGSTQTIKDAMAALSQEVMQLGQSVYSQPSHLGLVIES
ncbi:hypothetical protein K2173_006802 [Erythroxylum novogranatense]|uniref:Heat shock protein 70 n=1 Tax=Erythroxylum novogranatense TaxID=1862640 RepID=A0AAV8SXS9_9ROSI|nr:hypothetical protein K2173_006802 [Erythroxylum novogranatense]